MRTVWVILKSKGQRTEIWGLGYETQEEAEIMAQEMRHREEHQNAAIRVERRQVER